MEKGRGRGVGRKGGRECLGYGESSKGNKYE